MGQTIPPSPRSQQNDGREEYALFALIRATTHAPSVPSLWMAAGFLLIILFNLTQSPLCAYEHADLWKLQRIDGRELQLW